MGRLVKVLAVKPVLGKPDVLRPLQALNCDIAQFIEIALDPCDIRSVNLGKFG